jgi:hypothetical protein
VLAKGAQKVVKAGQGWPEWRTYMSSWPAPARRAANVVPRVVILEPPPPAACTHHTHTLTEAPVHGQGTFPLSGLQECSSATPGKNGGSPYLFDD